MSQVASDAEAGETPAAGVKSSRGQPLLAIAVAATLLIVYATTLLPGVGVGDSAELQYMTPLLGICHPPGFAFQVVIGKLWLVLTGWSDPAWRLNLLMTVCGAGGAGLLCATIWRIAQSRLAAATAALTLGLSSAYWRQCVQTEVYVFYGLFLLLAMYALVRSFESRRVGWLCVAVLALGVSIGNRPSELSVLPAFGLLLLAQRTRPRLTLLRSAAGLALFVLPWLLSACYFWWPAQREGLHGRDGNLRAKVTHGRPPFDSFSTGEKFERAAKYTLGLNWARQAGFANADIAWQLDKYSWLHSGLNALGPRFVGADADSQERQRAQGNGTNVGPLGTLLALVGIAGLRRQPGWALLGAALVAGNFAFYVWHHPWDNLEFIVPGTIGWCVLVGLGAAELGAHLHGRLAPLALAALCAGAPLFLLLVNYRDLDRSTPSEQAALREAAALAAAPWPQESVVAAPYIDAMRLRYILQIMGERRDLRVIPILGDDGPEHIERLLAHFSAEGTYVYFTAGTIPADARATLAAKTDPTLRALGFLRVVP